MRDSQYYPAVIVLGLAAFCLLIGKTIASAPLLPLVLIVSIGLFIFAFAYTDSAMVLLIFMMLLSPEISFGAVSRQQDIMVRVDDLLIVVFMLAWLARSALTKNARFIRKLPVNRFILAYTLIFVLTTLKGMIIGNVQPVKGLFFVFKYIEYFMVFYLATGIITDKKQILAYLKAFIFVFAIVTIYGFTQIGGVKRISAPFETSSEPNTLGGYMVLLIGLCIGLLTHTHLRTWRWPVAFLTVLSIIPFGLTLSRASYMAIVATYLTLIVFNKFTGKVVLLCALFAAAAVFLVAKPQAIMDRFADAFTPEYQEGIAPVKISETISLGPSASARVQDWIALFQKWKEQPFLGYGVTGTRFVDSQFIKVLVESGLVGLIAFLILMFIIFRQTLRIYKTTKDDVYKGLAVGFLAGHVGMLVHAISANTFIIIRIMEPYWFLAAMVMLIPELEKKAAAPKLQETPLPVKNNYIRNVKFLLNSARK